MCGYGLTKICRWRPTESSIIRGQYKRVADSRSSYWLVGLGNPYYHFVQFFEFAREGCAKILLLSEAIAKRRTNSLPVETSLDFTFHFPPLLPRQGAEFFATAHGSSTS